RHTTPTRHSATERRRTRSSLRVLVADANADERNALKQSLAELGHQPCVVDSGAEVVRLHHSVPSDVVILDTQLSGVDVYELALTLHRERPTPVLFAGAVLDTNKLLAMADGPTLGHVAKPVRTETLDASLVLALRS